MHIAFSVGKRSKNRIFICATTTLSLGIRYKSLSISWLQISYGLLHVRKSLLIMGLYSKVAFELCILNSPSTFLGHLLQYWILVIVWIQDRNVEKHCIPEKIISTRLLFITEQNLESLESWAKSRKLSKVWKTEHIQKDEKNLENWAKSKVLSEV